MECLVGVESVCTPPKLSSLSISLGTTFLRPLLSNILFYFVLLYLLPRPSRGHLAFTEAKYKQTISLLESTSDASKRLFLSAFYYIVTMPTASW